MLTGDRGLPRTLALDYREAALSPQDAAMLDYVVSVTRSAHAVRGADVDHLRALGFDDAAILDMCQVAAYYNYVNRLADGLGVELEDFWKPHDMIISREEFEAL